jgi:tRNA threonylcarbamoyladenosine biosynthesis protein TsaB
MLLTLRTDSPDAEVGLYDGEKQLSYFTWHADRQLAKDLLRVIHEQLQKQKADWSDISGVVVFEGPGSFTGLRIGITVANAIAYGQSVPVIAGRGDDWLADGLARLQSGDNDRLVMPQYGSEAHITLPKK